MKILYGIQGTGNGHISRSRMMARRLGERRDVEVTYLFSGRPKAEYFDMEIFGDFLCRRGLTFHVDKGQLQYFQTLRHNSLLTFLKEVRTLNLSPYDLVITDFEPVTAWAARFSGKPVLGLGHQYAFAYDIPREGENLVSRLLMRNFAPARRAIGLHWDSFGGPILPPIVDPELTKLAASLDHDERKIIVYLPFENQSDVTELLRKLPDFQFYQYSSGLTDGRQDNVHLRKACHGGFMRDLCSSRAVICNAGFELVSEALQLGLQILVKPLHGQPEQLSNAAALTHLDLGTRVNSLNREFIADWLDELPATDRNATSTSYPDVAAALVDWIADGQNDNPATLVERLWLQCRQSEYSEAMTPQFAK